MEKTNNQNNEDLRTEANLETQGYFEWLKDKDGFEQKQREFFKMKKSTNQPVPEEINFVTIKIDYPSCYLLKQALDKSIGQRDYNTRFDLENLIRLSNHLNGLILSVLERTQSASTIDLIEPDTEYPF